jgi:glycerol-3-phosphate acyltransferase PlsY
MGPLIITLIGAYLAGSINFSILVCRLLGKPDPRKGFSGNPGATNVYRQAGWPLAALVLFLDMGRSAAVALLARYALPPQWVWWVAVALIFGNHFPLFHNFKGGKGVANYLGFSMALMPVAGCLAIVVYAGVLAVSRIAFVASFALVAVLAGFAVAQWGQWPMVLPAVVTTVGLIVWFHRSNIFSLVGRKW